MQGNRVILGIESSCDDTAVAVVRARPGQPGGEILASVVAGPGRAAQPSGAAWSPRSPRAPTPSGSTW